MKRLCILAALCGATVLAQAQTEKVDPELRTQIRKLLVTMHLDDLLRQQLKTSLPPMIALLKQNPSVSPQFADEFSKQFEARLLASNDLTDMIVDAYADRFSLSEVKDLQAFYNSPTGKKIVEVQPELMSAVAKKAGAYGQTLAKQVAGDIAKQHPDYLLKKDDASPDKAPPPEQ